MRPKIQGEDDDEPEQINLLMDEFTASGLVRFRYSPPKALVADNWSLFFDPDERVNMTDQRK